MMRLLAVIEAAVITGPAKNLLEFAGLARPRGVEVTVVAFARGSGTNAFIEAARAAGTAVEIAPERRAFDRGVIPAMREVVARVKPDLIQTHAVKSHFLVRWAGLTRFVPWVAFHHGYTQSAPRELLYNQLDRWSLRAARKVITVSAPFRDELTQRGVRRENIEIVHNAIAPDWRKTACSNSAALRQRLGIPADAPVILSVGRLSKEKDHLALLKALQGLKAYLVVVGEGPERASFERAIAQFGLLERVILAGQQESGPFYGIAQAVAISSRSEGSPNVLLEAMATGVPVVATRVGGIPEHVEEGKSTLLVDQGDAVAMRAAITKLIGPNRELAHRLAVRGRELVQERHAPEARVRRLIGIYESVLPTLSRGSSHESAIEA